jgi:hypothetical protein
MFVLGFAVSFVGVGGPRLVGLATGTQLLYILACFPPYDPESLGWRLAGFTLAVLLLAGAELVLWPDPTPVPYTAKLAIAVSALAGCLVAVAEGWSGRPGGRDRLAALLPGAADAAEALRPSRLPPMQRPASAGRRDRARQPHCCGRPRHAPRPRRPGCAARARCRTRTVSPPLWTSSAPTGRPPRPTASRPTGCAWVRSR